MVVIKTDKFETIQDISLKLVDAANAASQLQGPKETTILFLGTSSVGKTTAVNRFFDKQDAPRANLNFSLDYSFCRRTAQNQILNIWELGGFLDSNAGTDELLEIPMRIHGINNFSAILMVDLSKPEKLLSDIQSALTSLKGAAKKTLQETTTTESNEIPFPVMLVGGKYDLIMDYDPELKKHICRCMHVVAHSIGASLLFYSMKIPKLSKTLRDIISHLGFGSPSNPFRQQQITDYNEPLMILYGADNAANIGIDIAPNNIEAMFSTLSHIIEPLVKHSRKIEAEAMPNNPAKDPGFKENVIDEIRAQKDEELTALVKQYQISEKFESVNY